jgi:hypothetical protein
MNAIPFNPWFSIWLRPRDTMRSILDRDPKSRIWFLAALGGISQVLHQASAMEDPEQLAYDPISILVTIAILGVVYGMVSLWVMPYPVCWTGRWLGGTGNVTQVRSSLAWAQVPGIWTLLLYALLIGAAGPQFVSKAFELNLAEGGSRFALAIVFTIGIITIWQVFTTLKTLAEAQGFSAWRALANLVLTGLLVAVVVALIAVVAGLAAGLFDTTL